MKEIDILLGNLRDYLRENVPTKNKEITETADMSKGVSDKIYDIDIFLSRKPGMRSSVQLIKSDNTDKEDVKVSCIVAICSLLDTLIDNKLLDEKEVKGIFITWLSEHDL